MGSQSTLAFNSLYLLKFRTMIVIILLLARLAIKLSGRLGGRKPLSLHGLARLELTQVPERYTHFLLSSFPRFIISRSWC